jgi:hypothetical protein
MLIVPPHIRVTSNLHAEMLNLRTLLLRIKDTDGSGITGLVQFSMGAVIVGL